MLQLKNLYFLSLGHSKKSLSLNSPLKKIKIMQVKTQAPIFNFLRSTKS